MDSSQKELLNNSSSFIKTFIGMSILIILYFLASTIVQYAARSTEVMIIFGHPFPYSAFAGILSSIANICVIMIVVFYRKPGFIAALLMNVYQLPGIFIRIFDNLNPTAISGLFATILTVTAIIMIRISARKVEKSGAVMKEQAIMDRLTSLPNRFAFSELLGKLTKSSKRFAIVSVDINGFKSINKTMGYEIGNKVLKELAQRWMYIAETRTSEKKDNIARVAGDEFMLVIYDYNSNDDLEYIIKQYEAALCEIITIDDCDFYITASFGYAEYPNDALDGDGLAACADAAMNEIKRLNSSDHILRYTPDLMQTERTIEIEREIRTAMVNDLFSFDLQPQFDMSHKLRGYEVLARMKDQQGNEISPSEFIPVAEKVGIIDKVDFCVFEKASKFFGDIVNKTGTEIHFCINVSVRHLMKNNFIDEIKQIIDIYGISPNQLEVEMTESIMIDSVDKALQRVNELKEMGVTIAIDDFGTGYSSLSYLSKFPADILKIDKEFIDKISMSESSKQYVASIISIGHVMNFKVIAEGVEDAEQIEILKSIGCDYIQGYFWGEPMSYEHAEKQITGSI